MTSITASTQRHAAPRPARREVAATGPSALALWLGLAVVAGVAMCVYVALDGRIAEAWFQVCAWGAVGTFFFRVRRLGALRLPWLLVGGGFALFALGDLLFSLNEYLWHIDAFPSSADVAYLAGYPVLTIGLAALVRREGGVETRAALIDAGIVITPLAVTAWLYLIEPSATGSGVTLLEQAVSGAYPVGDLLCLAVIVRLLAGLGANRSVGQPALGVLVGGLVAMLAADIAFVYGELHGSYVSGGWLDSVYLVSYLALAATAMSPSIIEVGTRRFPTDVTLSRRRLVLLALAALSIPGLLALQWWRGAELTVPLVVGGTVVSFLLVVARMSGLVHALEASRSQLRFEATHDVLTGLPNRQCFDAEFERTLRRGQAGALMFVDLDQFKAVNDTLGHREGDRVLVDVASVLTTTVRKCDMVARYAGDEFVVLLDGTEPQELMAIAERLSSRLDIRRIGVDGELTVTASIGLVQWTSGTTADTAERLLHAADGAMYEAKRTVGTALVIAERC